MLPTGTEICPVGEAAYVVFVAPLNRAHAVPPPTFTLYTAVVPLFDTGVAVNDTPPPE